MIPLTLRLRNFMSYGDEPVTVDFEGLHLACLSGRNGNGKSALLDAITWALWGHSRAKREDDLVRQGATEMEVELCFHLGAGRYRVLRKRSLRAGGGKSALELHVFGDGAYNAATGGTMAETQARLAEILKLSYETFINSSFLLQGRADEFTVKPPAKRKEVLGEILGLNRYDRLAERAREHYKERTARMAIVREAIVSVEKDLARRETLREELCGLVHDHECALQQLREAESRLKVAQAELQALSAEQRNLDGLERAIAGLREELVRLEQRHATHRQTVSEADDLLAHQASIAAGVEELRLARAESEEMGARAARAMELQPGLARLRQEIDAAAAELRTTAQCAGDEAAVYELEARKAPWLQRQVQEYEAAAARLPGVEAERAALVRDALRVQREIERLQDECTRLQAEMEPLRERLRLLKEPGAACPVCGAPMNEADRDRVYSQFRDEGLARREQVKANEERIAALEREAAGMAQQEAALTATLATLTAQGQELGRLQQALQSAEAASGAARAATERRERAQLALERRDFAAESRAHLAAAEQALADLGYDRARHEALRRRVQELTPLEARAAELAGARERRAAAVESLGAVEGDMARRCAELRAMEESAADLREKVAVLPEVEATLRACEEEVARRGHAAQEIDRVATARRELLRVLDEQEDGLREKRVDLATLERESGAYAELARIFGKKDGIQTMLIDNALPELESRANAILTRMSDGNMQVQFATQAQGSRGDALETLDIRIADSSGTRPYEMFSGGEAFRANFAIRLALSRLLTERAGAQLQLLVIDEGFGTQDSQGRERLIEAINSIAADFAKIVVVTHLDELKDLFNTRIEVVKGVDGSRITMTM